MQFPTVTIDASIKSAWPDTCLGCMAYSVEVSPGNPEFMEYYENSLSGPLLRMLSSTELADIPQIQGARAAFRAFGIDPGRHRVSSEALYRRVRQGKSLYKINSLVDANNLVSLETGFSLGSYDASRVGADVAFRLGRPGESYAGIGKADIPLENMPVLADESGPFGSPISDSTRAMITESTVLGLTIMFSFSGSDALADKMELLERQMARFAGVKGAHAFIV